ncbi:MAG: ankyrin repeat domain-containing protein [Desulfomonile sp.]|jgi:ankyrin repeat protein
MGFLSKIYGGPLVKAVNNGEVAEVARLLNDGCDPNESQLGITALENACGNGHIEIVQLLLDKGADVNAKDWDGITVLMAAARGPGVPGENKNKEDLCLEIVELLLKKGADAKYTSWRRRTALKEAEWAGHARVKELLQQHGAKR